MAVGEKGDWHLTVLNKPKVCSVPGGRGYGWEGESGGEKGEMEGNDCLVCGC